MIAASLSLQKSGGRGWRVYEEPWVTWVSAWANSDGSETCRSWVEWVCLTVEVPCPWGEQGRV